MDGGAGYIALDDAAFARVHAAQGEEARQAQGRLAQGGQGLGVIGASVEDPAQEVERGNRVTGATSRPG